MEEIILIILGILTIYIISHWIPFTFMLLFLFILLLMFIFSLIIKK